MCHDEIVGPRVFVSNEARSTVTTRRIYTGVFVLDYSNKNTSFASHTRELEGHLSVVRRCSTRQGRFVGLDTVVLSMFERSLRALIAYTVLMLLYWNTRGRRRADRADRAGRSRPGAGGPRPRLGVGEITCFLVLSVTLQLFYPLI